MEGEDGANTLSGVIELTGSSADDGQQNGDDFIDTQRTESSQSNNTIGGALARLEFSNEPRQEFIDDDGAFVVTEITHDGDGVFLGGQEAGATDGIQQIGDSSQSSLLHFSTGLNRARFQQILEQTSNTIKKQEKKNNN